MKKIALAISVGRKKIQGIDAQKNIGNRRHISHY
jgi:hypothetical protein